MSCLARLATLTLQVTGPQAWLTSLHACWGPLFVERTPSRDARRAEDPSLSLSPLSEADGLRDRALYQRGDLVVIEGERPQLFCAFVDGSFGSIEASLQVVFQRLLRAQRGLLIHASAGVYQGEAWLIPGPSGAGKSTAVRGGFERVLSDELVALTLDPQPTLWGTPFWSEGRDERLFPYTSEGVKLSALTFPVKGSRPSLAPLGAVEAARRLARCVTSYEGRAESAELFHITCELAERVASYRLTFPRAGHWRAELSE